MFIRTAKARAYVKVVVHVHLVARLEVEVNGGILACINVKFQSRGRCRGCNLRQLTANLPVEAKSGVLSCINVKYHSQDKQNLQLGSRGLKGLWHTSNLYEVSITGGKSYVEA